MREVPSRVRIIEVAPRDGLQNEPTVLSTEAKLEFIRLLSQAGYTDIEVGAFVHPSRVPQLADSEELFSALPKDTGIEYSALVPNQKGLERASKANVRAVAFLTAASDTFLQNNIGMNVSQSLDSIRNLIPQAHTLGMWTRAYISTAFDCPFEGNIQPAAVASVVRELEAIGVNEISIGDTIGRTTPNAVADLLEILSPIVPMDRIACHFHDTYGFALANVLTALQYGVSIFDSSAGGTGGCPYAPGAAGNLATEELLNFLHRMGIKTGVELESVRVATQFLATQLGRNLSFA